MSECKYYIQLSDFSSSTIRFIMYLFVVVFLDVFFFFSLKNKSSVMQ